MSEFLENKFLFHLIVRFLLQHKTCFVVSIGSLQQKHNSIKTLSPIFTDSIRWEDVFVHIILYCVCYKHPGIKDLWNLLYQSSHFFLLILLSPKVLQNRPTRKKNVMSCNSKSSCWLLRTKWPSNKKQSPRDGFFLNFLFGCDFSPFKSSMRWADVSGASTWKVGRCISYAWRGLELCQGGCLTCMSWISVFIHQEFQVSKMEGFLNRKKAYFEGWVSLT